MSHRPTGFGVAVLAGAWLSSGCAPTTNLLSDNQPAFLGSYASAPVASKAPLRVVTFNIRESREIGRAIAVLRSDSIRGADVVALQEMSEGGVDRIARALQLIPLTPGGVGPVELGLTTILVGFGGPNAEVVAAVLLYRGLTILPTLVLGLATIGAWRWLRPRRGQGGVSPPAGNPPRG